MGSIIMSGLRKRAEMSVYGINWPSLGRRSP